MRRREEGGGRREEGGGLRRRVPGFSEVLVRGRRFSLGRAAWDPTIPPGVRGTVVVQECGALSAFLYNDSMHNGSVVVQECGECVF